MAQQELRSVITISGNVDSSFSSLSQAFDKMGDTLLNIGHYINPLSQKVTQFGKEAVVQYANFDDVMLKIKSVGEMTDDQMKLVEEATRKAGMTTRYTATDAAEASLLLTQVGLGYQEVIDLLPDVLNMAQAGDLSIATSADFLYSSLKSMGFEIDYADTLIDQMAKTASVGATDMDTLGQSLTRLGSGVKLIKGGSSEVLTILSAMSEYGKDMLGTMGGTALRNFFLSLAAPAGGKQEVVAMLESVGASVEELEEIMEDVELSGASLAIKKMGLDIYNSEGELNNGIDIIRSLRDAMAGLTKEQQNKALGQIFGSRTLTTAFNLIRLTDEEWNKLQADIENSDGYAKYVAKTREGGFGGALRMLESQFEELHHTVGESLEAPVRAAADGIGQIIGYLTSLDDTTRENIVIAMGAIAAAGPALLGVGAGLKLLAFASTPGGAIALATIGLVGLAAIIQNLEQASISDSFGDMQLDMESLTPYITTLSTDFGKAVSALTKYSKGIDQAVESYTTASSTFSSELLTAAITGATLTGDDITKLSNLGGQMLDATLEGIALKQEGNTAFLDALFKGTEDQETKQNILDTQNTYFEGLYADAQQIGQTMRDQMTEALRDGSLDANENEAIMASVGRLNAINSQIADMQNRQEYEKLLHKGQTTSLDSLREFTDTVTTQRDQELAAAQETYFDNYAWTKIGYDDRITASATPDERDTLMREQEESLAAMDRAMEAHKVETASKYAGLITQAWNSALKSSDYGSMYEDMLGFSENVLADDNAVLDIGNWMNENNTRQLIQLIDKLEEGTDALGGWEGFNNQADMYLQSGEKPPAWLTTMGDQLNALEVARSIWSMGPISNVFVPDEYNRMLEASNTLKQLQQQEPITVPVTPELTGTDGALSGLEGEKQVDVGLSADPAPITTAINSLEGTGVGVDLSTDTSPVSSAISTLSGQSVRVELYADDSRIISYLSGKTYQGKVALSSSGGAYAEGGRADEASIFGEAGPEWAIPEEHSDRTANLLKSAAAASGFSWAELLDRKGGLNANASYSRTTIIYSPVIHAQDAEGVEETLIEDKKRLDDWWADKQQREERMKF